MGLFAHCPCGPCLAYFCYLERAVPFFSSLDLDFHCRHLDNTRNSSPVHRELGSNASLRWRLELARSLQRLEQPTADPHDRCRTWLCFSFPSLSARPGSFCTQSDLLCLPHRHTVDCRSHFFLLHPSAQAQRLRPTDIHLHRRR